MQGEKAARGGRAAAGRRACFSTLPAGKRGIFEKM